ncbi:transketolase family protein [Sulfurimonas autotrophica]|uniref:Transketolase subunit B n=1 Tax=Sulfurimonas autotrophica (strain ATCC BAA-671 / DSM 16294 / JCM 11897 / OK10) TaxID=563040 RepID=E0UUP5_SULAO|nr:transketolase C-terminal domain-containing protein [Sulfurimonas autotrophica]ADN09549.1 transketolase subunit B [Sulfurimonas autotrophica DSM 16294]
MRNTFVKTLVKLAETDSRIFVITPDLGFSVLEEFEEKYPDRFLNVGIAEANAVSIAAGLALSGKIVYVYSIIPFVIMRPFEQIRVDVAYMNTNVRLVGVGAGVTYGPAGATHHAIEDIALMRALPNMTVFAPSDPYEVERITEESINYQGPIYFRLPKKGEPIISNSKNEIRLGKANYIKKNIESEIAILFTSNASDLALDVEDKLLKEGYCSDLVSMHTIKPFDHAALAEILKTKKHIFTIEEHNVIGGLGSVVSEYIAESIYNPVFKRFALPDEYSHYVGSQSYIRDKFGLTAQNITTTILELL